MLFSQENDEENPTMNFIGRTSELRQLNEEYKSTHSSLGIIYGRRRVGKSRLIEQFIQNKNFFRFEGLEPPTDIPNRKTLQIKHFLNQLAHQTGKDIYRQTKCEDWNKAFQYLTTEMPKRGSKFILVFDEFPWMASGKTNLIGLMKYFYDNEWKSGWKIMIILCGSISSFMVNKVIKSSALYGRITQEIHLHPFTLKEVKNFFNKAFSDMETCLLYMTFGGIPFYLELVDINTSPEINLNRLFFRKNAFFLMEFSRIFRGQYQLTNYYTDILRLIAKRRNLSKIEIEKLLGVEKGGGTLTTHLRNLALADFVEIYTPLNKTNRTNLIRYRIQDEFTRFFFSFVEPHVDVIKSGTVNSLKDLISDNKWNTWKDLSFEKMVMKHLPQIIKILNLEGRVNKIGSYFTKSKNGKKGAQIDLMIERNDKRITVCEIKFYQNTIGKWIIPSVQQKIKIFPNPKKHYVEKVLITSYGITKNLRNEKFFNHVITINDLFI